jgi:hypothetical protein
VTSAPGDVLEMAAPLVIVYIVVVVMFVLAAAS